jgi:hypothetical protein
MCGKLTPFSSRGSAIRPRGVYLYACSSTGADAGSPLKPVFTNPGDTVFTRAKSFHSTARDLHRWITPRERVSGVSY